MSQAEAVVQRQLAAYNARNLDAWLATYAADAQVFALHEGMIASGHAELRARMTARFLEPDLHAELLGRQVMDSIVVDHKRITRNFAEGCGTIEMLCIYEVRDGRITKATFASAAPALDASLGPSLGPG